MNIIERVKSLDLPLDQLIVIGSGLLDALELRKSRDIDLVLGRTLFQELKNSGEYKVTMRHGEYVLEKGSVEAWEDWGEKYNFKTLQSSSIVIRNVHFCHPDVVIYHKNIRATKKDLNDIQLLKNYMDENPEIFR